ncbi:MAG: hypothetical protein KF760_25190 [Candidatus Eremiobacteraeota bacterium]|nr:hypothetical protein [Candidatus Eremiobacteraeota bacterium]MCW5871020.1 hypothetical protein [Candidatus Eremiobacteraeota bacterium]
MKTSRRAFTLLEAMLSLFFVMLLLGLFANLAHEFEAVLKQSASKANTLTTLQVGLRHVLDEVRQAVPGSISPGTGVELRLSRVSQELTGWLPTTPPASPWTPPASLTRVRYYLSQGTLLREAGSPPTLQPVAEGLSAFQVQVGGSGPLTVEVKLTQEETKRQVVIKGLALVARF